MILCPYCGKHIEYNAVVSHELTVVCSSCGNTIKILLSSSSAWDRVKKKVSAHNFLVRAIKRFSEDAFSFCAVCGAPSLQGGICRDCLRCPSCKKQVAIEAGVVTCESCQRSMSLSDFIARKQILEDDVERSQLD